MLIVDFFIIVIGLFSWFYLKFKDSSTKRDIAERTSIYSETCEKFKERHVDQTNNCQRHAQTLASIYISGSKILSKENGEYKYVSPYSTNEQLNKIYHDAKKLFGECNLQPPIPIGNQMQKLLAEMIMAVNDGIIPVDRYYNGYFGDEYKLMIWIRKNSSYMSGYKIIRFKNKHWKQPAYAWEGSRADPGLYSDDRLECL